MRPFLCALWVAMAGLAGPVTVGGLQAPTVLSIDAAASRVFIDVGRAGLFGFAGHDHEVLAAGVAGRVVFDPDDWPHASVSLEFDVSMLKVTGKGEPPSDVPEVQRVMLSDQVMDPKRFPVVSFRSRRVSAVPSGSAVDLAIEGDLTLHGVTRPLTVHARASLDPEGVTARGTFSIRQTDFGITPVTAAGGTVRVKNEVGVRFSLRARRSG